MARFLKLERMEISGFKSFYGRTSFEFPEGITAVVGPNGCGKSNIGDAISWVLGEQKASSLRSERMEDVIFSGSETRRPLGMAEVSLHFKNLSEGAGNGNDHSGHHTAQPGNGSPSVVPEILDPPPLPADDDGVQGDEPATDRVVADGPLAIPNVQEVPESDATGQPGGEEASVHESPEAQEAGKSGMRFYLEDLPEIVVVTRRLYRSGESEYALNGQRCRLRDVQDLLSMMEIGSRLYSSIEQGRIDQILAAKPKDRRAIIEEAAGILGYKVKRRQAEGKLEAAKANLLRISDITGEVEKQINTLKRQAAKARRYRRLQETLRGYRGVITHQRGLVLQAGRRGAAENFENLRGRDAASAAEMSRVEAEIEKLRLDAEQAEEALRARRDEMHALDIEIDRMHQKRDSAEEQARELTVRIGAADPEIAALSERSARLDAEAGRLTEETTSADAALSGAREAFARTDSSRNDCVRRIEESERTLEEARGELLRTVEDVAVLSRTRAALEEQVRLDGALCERLVREIGEASTQRLSCAGTVTEIEAAIAARAALLENKIRERDLLAGGEREAGDRVRELERRSEELKGRASALAERLEALHALENQHVGYARGVGEILDGAAGIDSRGLVASRIEVPRGLEKAVTAALGELLEAILVPGQQDALSGVTHLRRNEAGRVAFIPDPAASQDPPAPAGMLPPELAGRSGVQGLMSALVGGAVEIGPVASALARTVLVDDLSIAIDLHPICPEYAFVTPAGDCLRTDGAIVGGDGPEFHHGVLVRRAEIADISEQMRGIGGDREGNEALLPEARAELLRREEMLRQAALLHQEDEKTLLEQRVKLDERRADRDRLDATIPLLEGERDRLRREEDERARQIELNATAITAAEERRHQREREIEEAIEALGRERDDLDRLQKELSEARAQQVGGEQRAAALSRERQAMDGGRDEVRERLERLVAQRLEWAQHVASLSDQKGDLTADLDRSTQARAEAAARDEAGQAGLAYTRSLLHAREGAVKESRAVHEAIRNEMQEEEVALARLDSDLEHLETACREELAISFSELNAKPPAMEEGRDLPGYEEEVEGIKRSLEGIGPVNLMAIEQFTELEERFEYLSAQMKDLEESVVSLRETMSKINRESRQRFMVAFESIQQGFQKCFATLFGGGRSELRLQDT
ncbi:MAG: AAA family ATPase, partial [Acidobacteria bacterium]|nr:AAA family ATPase [Acidobacteriota bacterium]